MTTVIRTLLVGAFLIGLTACSKGDEVSPHSVPPSAKDRPQTSVAALRATGWTACDLALKTDVEKALGVTVDGQADGGKVSRSGDVAKSTCNYSTASSGAVSLEASTYDTTEAAKAGFDTTLAADEKDDAFAGTIAGLGDRAYTVRNSVAVRYENVVAIITYGEPLASGDAGSRAERARRAVAARALSRLAALRTGRASGTTPASARDLQPPAVARQ
jgi:hypothetical protein